MAENQKPVASDSSSDEINLRELFLILWEGKWLVSGVGLIAAVLAVIVVLFLPNTYRAEALLAPNNQEATGGLSALAAQYGGLANLAGIDIGGRPTGQVDLGLEVLKSRKFISGFIQRHNILVPLVAAEGWDRSTGELEINSDEFDVTAGQWIRDVRPPKQTIPSAQEAYKAFMEILAVGQNKKTGFVTIAIEHYSPTVAKQWVDWLVEDINATIMKQDVDEAEEAISYLNRQIRETSLTELHSVFFRLIEQQTKTVMLAKVSDEYLLKTLDPAIAPEIKSSPKRALIVIATTVLAGGIAAFLILVFGLKRGE